MIEDQRFAADRAGTSVGVQMAKVRLPAACGPLTKMLFAELSQPPQCCPARWATNP